MGWLSIVLLVLFIPICLLLILIVLLQAGKGGGLAGAFGGTGGQTFLGARGAADFLSKLTIYLAVGFMVLSLILSVTYGRGKTINIGEEPEATKTGTPAGEAAATQQRDAAEAGQSEAPPADQGGETPSSEEAK